MASSPKVSSLFTKLITAIIWGQIWGSFVALQKILMRKVITLTTREHSTRSVYEVTNMHVFNGEKKKNKE